MIDTDILWSVGWGSVGLVLLAWLAVSFVSAPSWRERLARLGAIGLYGALLCLFLSGFQGAESRAGRIGFGFLVALFSAGLLVSLWKLLRRPSLPQEDAAH